MPFFKFALSFSLWRWELLLLLKINGRRLASGLRSDAAAAAANVVTGAASAYSAAAAAAIVVFVVSLIPVFSPLFVCFKLRARFSH